MSFTHLHVHGSYSPLDGLGTPDKLVKKAKELGFEAIGITDHGNIDSFIKLQKACMEVGIKPVFGVEMYIDENRNNIGKESGRFHICLFVKNLAGFRNLQKLITIANLEGFSKKPRIDPTSILKHSEGLVLSTACLASFINNKWGVDFVKQFAAKNPGDVYFEIMPIAMERQIDFNSKVIALAKKLKFKIIATNDVHYLNAEDSELQEVMLAINSRAKWNDPNRWKFECQTHYLCSQKEMIQMFRKNHPQIDIALVREALLNTQEIVDKCGDFVIEKCPVVMPLIPGCKEGEEDQFLTDLIFAGLKTKIKAGKIAKDRLPQYRARIEEEFELLKSKRFVRYFLIVWEMMDWCKKNDILTGPGRGSAGGSLIAYLIGVVQVDPLEYDLLFSRFISPSRDSLPDIDTDFPDDKRHLVREHVQDLYGINNVAGISTFLTIKGKGSIQDVARVFDIPKQEVNALTKLIDDEEDLTVETFTDSDNEDVRDFARKYPQVVDYAVRLQHTVRGYGQHAAGVCISNEDLRDGSKCSLVKRKNEIVCNWDKDDAEYMGLVKMDFLGLSALSRIHECLELIEQNYGEKIVLEDLTYDDPNVFSMIDDGDTTGIFQLGTYGITKLCKNLGISEFKNLYNATALYRPGPLGSGMTDEFVERKNGKRFKHLCKEMAEITKDTYGIIVYQEQVMAVCNKLGGMSWGECDTVRKLMAKSKGVEALEPFREKFVKGCVDGNILEEDKAGELWGQLAEFGKYGFNKSHSIEYTIISYYDAWLKYYYPLEFFASYLTYSGDDKKKELMRYICDSEIEVKLPKIGVSKATRWQVDNESLVMPFSEIVGVGESRAIQIEQSSSVKRKGFFGGQQISVPASTNKILCDIKAFDKDYQFEYKELKNLQDYFIYPLKDLFFE